MVMLQNDRIYPKVTVIYTIVSVLFDFVYYKLIPYAQTDKWAFYSMKICESVSHVYYL